MVQVAKEKTFNCSCFDVFCILDLLVMICDDVTRLTFVSKSTNRDVTDASTTEEKGNLPFRTHARKHGIYLLNSSCELKVISPCLVLRDTLALCAWCHALTAVR